MLKLFIYLFIKGLKLNMTSGTSQGLFVVVAIVIFGIFIGLTYTLFGSEGLSNDLKGIFTNATEQTNAGINNSKYYSEQIDKITADDDFEFDKTTGTITNYIGTSKDIVIPYEIDKVKVKVIGDSAFKLKKLVKVVFPNTITIIEDNAFRDNNLVNITLPDSVISIGSYSFWSNSLVSIDLGNSLESINYGALAWNQLKTINLPTTLKKIGDDSLKGNLFTAITIPKSVETLGINNFSNSVYLEEIKIPSKFKPQFESNNKNLIKKYESAIEGGISVLEYFAISDITFY